MGAERRLVDAHAAGSRGASLVEFALIVPVLLMLLLGMITGGLALNQKQQMTHATREGARFGATIAAEQEFSNADSWAENVRQLIVERSIGSLASADICVSLVSGATAAVVSAAGKPTTWFSTNGGNPCITGQTYPIAGSDTGRRVQVTATKPARIALGLFGSHNITLDSKATAKAEVGS